ncbi:MAG: hypothetical protein H6739_24220 [Alphaproteobacteria bacterium]|nr:hypothetical protein [Alphaproteobacteria bacterium]
MNALCCLLLLLFSGVAAADPEVDHHVAQAKLFVKKGWYTDARTELEAAVATPAGQTSYDAHWLLAQVCYELREAEAAANFARTAASLAESPDDAARAAGLADTIDTTFGVVVIQAPYEGVQSRLLLESESVIIDPELKRFVDDIALAWTKPQALPVRVALPVGDYRIQGAPVSVQPGSAQTLPLDMSELGSAGFAALQVTRVELATGVGALMGSRVANLRPSLELQVALTQPVKGWLVGVTWDYSVRSYSVAGHGTRTHPASFAAGVRLGRELMISGPLALRPAVGYRYGLVPGLAMGCVDGDTWSCTPLTNDSDEALTVYAISRAHVPFAELSVDWRKAGRTTATGFGVRIAYDQVIGRIPSPAEAVVVDSDEVVTFSTDARVWTSPGIRMLANLSLAF